MRPLIAFYKKILLDGFFWPASQEHLDKFSSRELSLLCLSRDIFVIKNDCHDTQVVYMEVQLLCKKGLHPRMLFDRCFENSKWQEHGQGAWMQPLHRGWCLLACLHKHACV